MVGLLLDFFLTPQINLYFSMFILCLKNPKGMISYSFISYPSEDKCFSAASNTFMKSSFFSTITFSPHPLNNSFDNFWHKVIFDIIDKNKKYILNRLFCSRIY